MHRKIIQYRGVVLKMVVSHFDGVNPWMEWRAVFPKTNLRIHDPTSCHYSVASMNFWLEYGKDEIHDYFRTQELIRLGLREADFLAPHRPKAMNRLTGQPRLVHGRREPRNKIRLGEDTKLAYNRLRPHFKISMEIYRKQMKWAQEEAERLDKILPPYIPPYEEEEQNGSYNNGEEKQS